ncbi:MAG: hypothetical protein ACT4OL_06400 [Nitrospiraceae bacterium]
MDCARGIVVVIAKDHKIPLRLVGVSEGVEDLQEFNPEGFVADLFG